MVANINKLKRFLYGLKHAQTKRCKFWNIGEEMEFLSCQPSDSSIYAFISECVQKMPGKKMHRAIELIIQAYRNC